MFVGVLAGRLNRRIVLDYVDRAGERADHDVVLSQISAYLTEKDAYRIRVKVRDRDEPGAPATFLSHRILSVLDPVTGESSEDVAGFLASVIAEADGRQPDLWPSRDADRLFTTDLGMTFDADGYATDHAFGIHKAFRAALDIRYIGERWVRGVPPVLAFEAGDVFACPPQRGRRPWDEERMTTDNRIQVVDAVADSLVENIGHAPGWVHARLYRYVSGEIVETQDLRCSQSEFLAVLHSGLAPPVSAVADAIRQPEAVA